MRDGHINFTLDEVKKMSAEYDDGSNPRPSRGRELQLKSDVDQLLGKAERIVVGAKGGRLRASDQRVVDRLTTQAAATVKLEKQFQEDQALEDAQIKEHWDMIRPRIGADAGPELGAKLSDAVGEVLSGRSVAYVDLPSIQNVVTGSGSAGDGVPIQVRNPVQTLAANSVIMSLPGIRHETMTSDRAIYPRIGAATVAGTAEGATLTAADTQTSSVTVVAQKYSTYEELSSELLEDYSDNALDAFGANLLKRLALRIDLGFLEGDGAADVVGIREVSGVNSTAVAATPTNFTDFRAVEYELRLDNADPRVWVMHPRSWNTLAGIKTGISSDETTLLEPDPQQGPRTLLSHPVRFSTQITLTEGAGAGSWAALLDTSQLVICERRPARLEVSRDFAFDRDVVAVRATWRGGLAVLNPEAISLATDIRA